MASVSSLDKDLRQMRLDKYTPAAASEALGWIQDTLGEGLDSPDLLEALKDGVALCKLVNLAVGPPGVKFKQSAMPFVQMENISHFLRACQAPPLNLHQHDTFLTVDLYEKKDPAQVLQCIGAFSRAASAANPSRIPTAIGPSKSKGSTTATGSQRPATPSRGPRDRGISVTSNASSGYGSKPSLPQRTGDSNSGRWSPTKSPTHDGSGSPGPVSSWSKKEHEGSTAPAWNIAQYGYMGGASQGNLGISFGGRRQITSAAPHVPSLAEKEKMRKEEEERQLEEERRGRAELEAEERQAGLEEERRWQEETTRLRNEEKRRAEEEKRKWEEEERQWRLTEEKRRKEEEEAEAKLAEERQRTRSQSDVRLTGQFLSQYQAEQKNAQPDAYGSRVKELEKELELARQREAEYEKERQDRMSRQSTISSQKARSRSRGPPQSKIQSPPQRQESWSQNEREFLRTQWSQHHQPPLQQPSTLQEEAVTPEPGHVPESIPEPELAPPVKSPRPLPDPTSTLSSQPQNTGNRPLPDPTAYSSPPSGAPQSRTGRFLSSNPAPAAPAPTTTYSRELGATAEQDAEDRRRVQSQSQTKAGGWASKSLLEREMEMERQRQQEWEEAQKETATAARSGDGVDGIGGGVGGKWDVGQWAGFTGGDNQNKGAQGIGAGRRQIVGPRPLPGSHR